jgi:hypothetical protein
MAFTFTRISVGFGFGSGTSWMTTPFGDATPAFIAMTLPVMAAHSRPKDGVASLAYVAAIHVLITD